MEEAPVWISVNGERRVVLSCTPVETVPLAAGHLLAEGWIRSAGELLALEPVPGPAGACGVAARIDPAQEHAAETLRRHQAAHGCGLRHFLDCEPMPARTRTGAAPPPELADSFRALFAAADAASPTGGVHAAAVCGADGALRHIAVDVARHCAVDRALGGALLGGEDLGVVGLVLTSRISGAIGMKAARAGVGWLASRSHATRLAHQLAAAAGLPLVEHAVRRERRP